MLMLGGSFLKAVFICITCDPGVILTISDFCQPALALTNKHWQIKINIFAKVKVPILF